MSNAITYFKSLIKTEPKVSHEFIMDCFKDVKDFRNDIFLDFMHNKVIAYQARATCVGFNQKVIRLYLRDECDYLPAKNRTIACFFIVRKNNLQIPCNFMSSVVASAKTNQSIHIDIVMPTEITHQQRRNNVRIPIDKSDIPNFRLWTKKETVGNVNDGKTNWQPIDQKDYEILDISAGGIMLTLDKNEYLSPILSKNTTFLCTGNFYNTQKQEQNFALVSNVRRITHNEKIAKHTIGLQFSKWTKVTEEQASWATVDDNGVSFLGTWLAPFKARLTKKTP